MKAGRLDIACHVIIMSFFISKLRRENIKLHLFFYGPPDPPKHLEIGSKAPLSKKDVSGLIKRLLYKYKTGIKNEALPDCFIEKKSLIEFIDELIKQGRAVYLLDDSGHDIRDVEIKQNPIFILGDHKGLPPKEKKRIGQIAEKVSLGKITYFASQALAIVQNELDRRNIF